MHICYVTSEYPKTGHPHGGIGAFVYSISYELIKRGHDVTVIGINTYSAIDEYEVDRGVEIYRLRPKSIKGLTWYYNSRLINRKLDLIHNKKPIDIVETSELGLAFIKKIRPTKYIVRLHGGHHFFAEAEQRGISPWKGWQENKSFKKADAFIAVSNYVKDHTAKYLSYNGKPVVTINNLIDLNVFVPRADITIEPNTIVFVGTVCEKKGVHNLIEAFDKVLIEFPNAKLRIIGRDWLYPNGNSYIQFLEKQHIPRFSKIKNHIEFTGPMSKDKLAIAYAKAEICCFPSLMETLGMVAPEAMAMNKLVVFTNQGPGPEIITHKQTGLLCNPYNSDDIADQLIWALKHKNTCSTIARKACEYINRAFDSNRLTSDNLNFYTLIQNMKTLD